MASCLGIYSDKNIIKYAKITSTADRISSQYTIDAYGVKFYDNIQTAVDEIADEVGLEQGSIALALSGEDYYITQVFSNLSAKDMKELILSEYAENKGENAIAPAVLELRTKLAQNSGSMDKVLALCVATSKGSLANLRQNYVDYKVESISPLPVSIKNLFENQAIDEEAIVVNIEDKTTITWFHRSEIQFMTSLPLGAQEIISKLSEKYNSTSKAYEACKKVSAYLEDAYDMDDETRDILDVVIPVLYDIRQQVEVVTTPFLKDVKKVYITGTGAIINNIDLYFNEVFLDVECEVVKPFFVGRDMSNTKDIIEVNSAIALALDGLGMADMDLNFNTAAKKAAGVSNVRQKIEKLNLKEKFETAKNNAIETMKRWNAPSRLHKRKRKKRNVDFDDGVVSGGKASKVKEDIDSEEVLDLKGFGRIDLGLQRTAILAFSVLVMYSVGAIYTNKELLAKDAIAKNQITSVNAAIAEANNDATYLSGLANQYVEITDKLKMLIAKINQQSLKTFDIPNFLSRLMFIMPANVRVTAINVGEAGSVEIRAESGQYAQLGYFVSRLKLERALLNVNMEVVSVDSNIKIIVSGVLP